MRCEICGGVVVYDAEKGYYVCTECGTVYESDIVEFRNIVTRKSVLLRPTKWYGMTLLGSKDARGNYVHKVKVKEVANFDERYREYMLIKNVLGSVPETCVEEVVAKYIEHKECLSGIRNFEEVIKTVAYVVCFDKVIPQLLIFGKSSRSVFHVMQCLGVRYLKPSVIHYVYLYGNDIGASDETIKCAVDVLSKSNRVEGDRLDALRALYYCAELYQDNVKTKLKQRIKNRLADIKT